MTVEPHTTLVSVKIELLPSEAAQLARDLMRAYPSALDGNGYQSFAELAGLIRKALGDPAWKRHSSKLILWRIKWKTGLK